MQIKLKNFEKFKKDLDAIKDSGIKAVKNTLNDTKRRAPGWVAGAVNQTYNIKKSELTPISKTAKKPQKKAGSVRIIGDTIEDVTLTYRGRLLTPTHFGMKVKQRPKGKGYFVTAQIKRPTTKSLGPDVFLGSNRAGMKIPFQRTSSSRYPIKSVKTLSVPQMVVNEQVAQDINERVNKGIEERLAHNLARAQGTGH